MKKECEQYAEEIKGITHISKMKDRGIKHDYELVCSYFLFESGDQQNEDGIILCFILVVSFSISYIYLNNEGIIGVSENPYFYFQVGSSRVDFHIRCHLIPSMLANSNLL